MWGGKANLLKLTLSQRLQRINFAGSTHNPVSPRQWSLSTAPSELCLNYPCDVTQVSKEQHLDHESDRSSGAFHCRQPFWLVAPSHFQCGGMQERLPKARQEPPCLCSCGKPSLQ